MSKSYCFQRSWTFWLTYVSVRDFNWLKITPIRFQIWYVLNFWGYKTGFKTIKIWGYRTFHSSISFIFCSFSWWTSWSNLKGIIRWCEIFGLQTPSTQLAQRCFNVHLTSVTSILRYLNVEITFCTCWVPKSDQNLEFFCLIIFQSWDMTIIEIS